MRKMNFVTILLIVLSAGNILAQDFNADDILGVWFNEEKDGKVEIYKENGKYYGKLIWLLNPIDEETGKPKLDKKNDDESLRSRPLKGIILMDGFVWDGDDQEWEDGTIYDPKSGNTYSCYMKLLEKDKLKVRGYIGFSLIGRTTYWTRTTKE